MYERTTFFDAQTPLPGLPAQACHNILLDLPLSRAWDKLQDLSLAAHYVPGLTACVLHPGPQTGPGASRRVLQKNGQWLDETVLQWHEEQGFVIRLHRAQKGPPLPFKQACFVYSLAAEGNATRLTTCLLYQPAGGVLGTLFDRWMLRRALNTAVAKIARNLKIYYETGIPQNRAYTPGHA